MAHILVVDDQEDFRRLVSRLLTAAGHTVEEAEDGRQAMEAYRARPSDLVILDLYMPDVDGVEAFIRLQQEFPDVRVIAVSGGGHLGQEDVLEIAAGVGARATLAKPVEKKALLAAVEEVLRAR